MRPAKISRFFSHNASGCLLCSGNIIEKLKFAKITSLYNDNYIGIRRCPMACIVNITLSVKPELRAECLHELSLILPGTKSYSGCHWVYLCENSDSDKIEAITKWDSREAYDTYLAWRQESGFFGGLGEKYLSGEPTWKFMPVFMDFNK
jgi:quinol monooxygenase YgiN